MFYDICCCVCDSAVGIHTDSIHAVDGKNSACNVVPGWLMFLCTMWFMRVFSLPFFWRL